MVALSADVAKIVSDQTSVKSATDQIQKMVTAILTKLPEPKMIGKHFSSCIPKHLASNTLNMQTVFM